MLGMAVNTLFLQTKMFRMSRFWTHETRMSNLSKTIGKSKALAATLSNTEPEDDSDDNDDEGILNAFTAAVDPIDGVSKTVDNEEDLVDSKFEKIDD